MARLKEISGVLLLLFLLTGSVYYNSLWTPFYYDDFFFVQENEGIAHLSNIKDLFSAEKYFQTFNERTYRPVTSAVYLLLKPFCQDNPTYWRLFNLSLHLLNCGLLYLILRRFYFKGPLALLAVGWFAAHPLLTELFNVVSFNEDLLGGCLALLAVLSYFQERSWLRILAICLYFLSCLAKETFIVLPLVLILFHLQELDYQLPKRPWFWLEWSGWVCGAGLFLLISFYLMKNPQPPAVADYPGGSLYTALLTFAVALVYALKLFWLPLGLTVIYNFPAYTSIFQPAVSGSLLILALLGYLLFYGYAHKKAYALYLSWFFLFLLPTANIIPYGAIFAERYLYFPLMGLIPATLLLSKHILDRYENNSLRPYYVGGICLILVMSVLTIKRNIVWQNPETLWRDVLRINPDNLDAQLNLGLHYYERKQYPQATRLFQEIIQNVPDSPLGYYNLGNVYAALGLYQSARSNYEQALQKEEEYISPVSLYKNLYNLGVVCFQLEDYQATLEHWQAAQKIRPDYPNIYSSLAAIYEKLGLSEQAAAAKSRYEALSGDKI